MKDGPFKTAIEKQDDDKVIMQQFIVLKIKNGQIVKETHMRNHSFFGDYHDSFMSEHLLNVSDLTNETMH
jgi:major membrane immunogen (membrane-anchored lipoprotein)